MKTSLAIAAAALTLSGCFGTYAARLKQISSSRIGCAPAETVITDDKGGMTGHTWTASCGARKFYCHESPGEPAACKEAISVSAQ